MTSPFLTRARRPLAVLTALGTAGLLAACASAPAGTATPTPSASAHDHEHEHASAPRLAVAIDGGVLLLDPETLTVESTLDAEGFVRINPVGDGTHLAVTGADGFRLLNASAGTWLEGSIPAAGAGHVVSHGGRTSFFADDTGQVDTLTLSELHDADAVPALSTTRTAGPHHGVAVPLDDGGLLLTLGTSESRTGALVRDASGAEIARSESCPGVHGETVAGEDTIVLGCANGALIYEDGAFRALAAPDATGRIGTQRGSGQSPVVLGDYKTDPDAELERPTRVSLIDTEADTIRLVELPASYSFRSLERGAHGEALVLGTDGALHIIDPAAGTITRSIPVVAPWTEPRDWQEARPAVTVLDHTVYVTEPATGEVHAVNISEGRVLRTAELPATPNEFAAVGAPAHEAGHGHGHGHGH